MTEARRYRHKETDVVTALVVDGTNDAEIAEFVGRPVWRGGERTLAIPDAVTEGDVWHATFGSYIVKTRRLNGSETYHVRHRDYFLAFYEHDD